MNSLAGLLGDEAGEGLDDIGCGHNELVLRCTCSRHKDWFFYVTLAVLSIQAAGEVIGSEPCGPLVTKSFTQSSLSPQHFKLSYESLKGVYSLQDLGSAEGTWLQFPVQVRSHPLQPGSKVQLGPYQFVLEQGERLDVLQEVIAKHRLTEVVEQLRLTPVLEEFTSLPVEQLPISPASRSRFEEAVTEVQTYASDLRKLQFRSPLCDFQAGIRDILIGSDSSSDICLPDLQPRHALLSFRYSSPCILRLCEAASVEISVRDPVPIYPGCQLRASDLIFDICGLNVGKCSQCGPRSALEDTEKVLQDLGICENLPVAYFSLFDGHGGISCAQYLREHLHTCLRDKLASSPSLLFDIKRSVKEALIATFQACDEDYRRTEVELAPTVGSTALVCLVLGDLLITANLGDSRAVLCRAGKAIDLSVDHKAVSGMQDNPIESERIRRLGGVISFRRIAGKMSFSRSFGDFKFKNSAGPLISIEPEVRYLYLDPVQDEFLILACDGLWDVFSSQEAVDFVRNRLRQMPVTEQDPQRVARELVNEAIYEKRSGDNVSVMVVALTCGM